MSYTEDFEKDIIPCVKQAMENEDIINFEINITGQSEKGAGVASDILFVNVSGFTTSGATKKVNLTIKMGKKNKDMRNNFNMRDLYLRETFVYNTILPQFENFQQEKGIKDPFKSVVKCYSTSILPDTELIALENLVTGGFEMYDKYMPMNLQHIKMVLENYAKFHAISFAMKDQQKSDFNKLTKNYGSTPNKYLGKIFNEPFFEPCLEKVGDILNKTDPDLAETFDRVVGRNFKCLLKKYVQLLDDDPENCVITHGDCWNCNFMFKYKDGDKKSPTDVVLLDWQLSNLHSPALDLSYFLYIVSSEEELAKFDEVLQFYYEHFSSFLRKLGSDPGKLFPFQTLDEHFRKYSLYGLVLVVTSLELLLSEDSVVDFENSNSSQGNFEISIGKVKIRNQIEYENRVKAVVRHYCHGK